VEEAFHMVGKTLGHYQISFQLGKGGMGEVFQAKDQVLGRDVAIKVLPVEFAKDPDRVARFQREAKLLASLNHSNIAAIHGLEESGGVQFLVLELVEGETLAERLKRGAIPVEESLKLSLQIAEALEAAHEKGVIHRDLKPANIKVTPDGKVKVLDFGLAKAFAGEQAELNLSNSPTLSNAATQQGVILGTAAYMSPEQAKGKAADKRADVWAFGCVVFEMLTAQSVFSADDVSQTLARVLERQPDFSLLPANLHPKLMEMLERCLEKEAKNRYGAISDARVDIQKALADPRGVVVQASAAFEPRTMLRMILPWVAAVIAVGAVIAGVAIWKLKPPEPGQVMRFEFELPEGQRPRFTDLRDSVLAISPDGKQLVYSTYKGLYLRPMDELTSKPIAGTEGPAEQPFFSPDGKWIGYFSTADRKLKKIAVNGSSPVILCEVSQLRGVNWSEDNTIVYGDLAGGIMQISSNGGAPEYLIKRASASLRQPQFLPRGKSVLYQATQGSNQIIMVHSLGSAEPRELFAGSGARYLPTGHIVYAVGNNLFAVPFDPDKCEVMGDSVPIVEGVFQLSSPQYAVSDSGALVYIPGTSSSADAARTLVWVDRNGKEEPLSAPINNYSAPRISPDGTRVALTVGNDQDADIWIFDVVRKIPTRLTFDKGADHHPLWSPDGKQIIFASNREGRWSLYSKAADGTGAIDKLGSMSVPDIRSLSWSGHGNSVVFEEASGGDTVYDIAALSMDGARERKPLLQGNFVEANPQISPDGKWMAYLSNETGDMEIYVRPFPDVNRGKWQVSTNGGQEPRWSSNGRELFYRSGDAMMAVAVETKPTFKAGVPETLFQDTYYSSYGHNWDISPDGKRFLMVKGTNAASESAMLQRFNIVLNWFEELKQRVPVQ
jgi:eukaryotic-like serine/threonine-protein kinase